MINIIWSILLIIGIVYTALFNNVKLLNELILNTPGEAVAFFIGLASLIIFWSGILNISKESGLLDFFTKKITFITRFLFPELKDELALKYISGNIIANILGLGAAATPFGLKAMSRLQELNESKEVANKTMITLLVVNTSGLTLIPTTIIYIRNSYQASITTEIISFIILSTFITTICAIALDKIFRRHYK